MTPGKLILVILFVILELFYLESSARLKALPCESTGGLGENPARIQQVESSESDLGSFKTLIRDATMPGKDFKSLLNVLARVPGQLQTSLSLTTTFEIGFQASIPLGMGSHVERSLPNMLRTLLSAHSEAKMIARIPIGFLALTGAQEKE